MDTDTISAIATASGAGGIGIVRLSGPQAVKIATQLVRTPSGRRLDDYGTHRAVYGHITDGHNNIVDECIAIIMRAPHSYTREDVVELQCHGGPMPLRRTLALTLECGARLAERGEFTKRAFLNGRLDLMQAQAVMDVISAKTESSLTAANGHLTGEFSAKIGAMRHAILGEIAHIEAAIDFPEDEVDDVVTDEVERTVVNIRTQIRRLLATASAGRILREGLRTAIVGRPNVGKSSLLNMLLREERAIVTDIAGTTRDSIEEYAEVAGVPLCIIDTAGIRETGDVVEKIGVERARKCVESAELVLALFDISAPLSADDEAIIELIRAKRAIVIVNKTDLAPAVDIARLKTECAGALGIVELSTKTHDGIEDLEALIKAEAYRGTADSTEVSFVRDEREAAILRRAEGHLAAALTTIASGMGLDFISIDLRSAWEALGELTGETVGEDIIDEIFSKFCIGK